MFQGDLSEVIYSKKHDEIVEAARKKGFISKVKYSCDEETLKGLPYIVDSEQFKKAFPKGNWAVLPV